MESTKNLGASVECPECGSPVELERPFDEWGMGDRSRWLQARDMIPVRMYEHYTATHPEYGALYEIEGVFERWQTTSQ